MKARFTFFLLLIFMSASYHLSAQEIHKCFSYEAELQMRAQHPELGTIKDFENWLKPRIEEYKQQQLSERGVAQVVTIPVIFHIIHDNDAVGTGDNISQALINAQVTQLNNDFRKLLGTSGYNTNAVGADVEVEFCLAAIDENGNTLAEPGIERINRTTKGWSAPPYGQCIGNNFDDTYIENTIKPQSQWNPNNYMNFWILDMSCGILGYAQFPDQSGLGGLNANGGLASTDGVCFKPSTIGSTDMPNPAGGSYNKGRTATHEIGHFLGLRHIWGDGGCSVDDYCADTPRSDDSNYGCPSGHVSCGTVDMIENYMDYTDDVCMNVFTADQKARIQTVLSNSPRRANLTTSTACSGGGNNNSCNVVISTFPYAQGWEAGIGDWTQNTDDNIDWTRKTGKTPSNGTGPTAASEGSYYMYIESSSPNYPTKSAILTSPCFDFSAKNSASLEFQYHMLGAATMGSVHLEASTNNGSSWTEIWSKSGNQGSGWKTATVNLQAYTNSTVQLRFRGITGTGWKGDMAIDDLKITTTSGGNGGCTQNELTLNISLDQYGSETTWTLQQNGSTIQSGGPYENNQEGTVMTETMCVPNGCYEFVINDAYSDGICCAYGTGSYELTDGTTTLASGGSFNASESTSFCVPFASCPTVDFNSSTIMAYGYNQDHGTATIQDNGATIFLQNNAWKYIDYDYTVTANTVLEFEFKSTKQGEIHGIGFDTDKSISSNRTFRVYGTQNWGNGNYDNYSGSNWKTYTIPVGNHYTGSFTKLFFTMDHDGNPKNGTAYFRNIKVYEGSCGGGQKTASKNVATGQNFELYPNPVSDWLTVTFDSKTIGSATVQIFSVTGKIMTNTSISTIKGKNQQAISVQELHNGTYILQINDGHRILNRKFSVLR